MKPIATSEVVRPPVNPQTKIWRYMDFTKFVAAIEHKGLFFSRCRQFEDPFEGSFPRANEPVRKESLLALNLAPERISALLSNRSAFYRWNRHWVVANCWHMSPWESAALWRLYSKTPDVVCIVSTYQRLRQCLPEEVLIGEVNYIDYNRTSLEEGNVMFPFVHKRLSFAHERELRALVWDTNWPAMPGGGVDTGYIPSDPGRWVSCELAALIELILVAPQSHDWFLELVRRVAARYALSAEVRRSSLDEAPFY